MSPMVTAQAGSQVTVEHRHRPKGRSCLTHPPGYQVLQLPESPWISHSAPASVAWVASSSCLISGHTAEKKLGGPISQRLGASGGAAYSIEMCVPGGSAN